MNKFKLFFTFFILITSINLKGQINQDCDGHIGIGSVSSPSALLELEDQEWMMFNAHNNSSGILFHEAAGKSDNSVQYGGVIKYNENEDALILGSYENNSPIDALFINRHDGGVGIGDNLWGDTYKLKVYGRAITTHSVWETSDLRFKENIEDLTEEPSLLKQLRGVSYKKMNLPLQNKANSDGSSMVHNDSQMEAGGASSEGADSIILNSPVVPEREYGFIAQELKEVLPNLVIEDEEGYLAVNYTGLIPLLVEAYKGLQSQVDDLQEEIDQLKNSCCDGATNETKSASTSSGTNDYEIEIQNSLDQNMPNPFTESTKIKFYLAKEVSSAFIYIYNMNGVQLKSIELRQKGTGNIILNGGEFNPGMYLYSLIADGQVIDTKRMILTD